MKAVITLGLIIAAIFAQDPHAGITLATGALVVIAIGNRPNPPRNA